MTLEELCALDGDKQLDYLEKLSDADLDKLLSPYYKVTRPEMAEKPTHTSKPKQQEMQIYIDPKKKAALAALEAEGISIDFMKKKFKK